MGRLEHLHVQISTLQESLHCLDIDMERQKNEAFVVYPQFDNGLQTKLDA